MTTAADFVDAYEAWKTATEEHQQMMSAIMQGGLLDIEAMDQKLAELDVLHANWVALATEFVPVKAIDGPAPLGDGHIDLKRNT